MIKNAADLAERITNIEHGIGLVTSALARVQSVNADAVGYVDGLASRNEGYLRLIRRKEEHEREVADRAAELLRTRKPAAAVAIFNLERGLDSFHREVMDFAERAAEPPDPVTSFLARTGGSATNLSTLEELAIQQLDETRQARYREELRSADPATVRARVADASTRDDDEARSFLRFAEHAYRGGWRGEPPQSAEQIDAAKDLQRRLHALRELRVPVEVERALDAIETAKVLVRRAQDPKLHNIQPANPAHDPAIAAAWEAEQPELLASAS